MVTSEDVCGNIRNVKLNDFVFQHAFYCLVCHCSLCTISYKVAFLKRIRSKQFWGSSKEFQIKLTRPLYDLKNRFGDYFSPEKA